MAKTIRIDPPEVVKAMAAIVARRRAAWRVPCIRIFPLFKPGETTTADYVRQYLNQFVSDRPRDYIAVTDRMHDPAPFITGAEVLAELVPDAPDERVPLAVAKAKRITAAPAAPTPAPKAITKEAHMPRTTAADKLAKINAFLAKAGKQPITQAQADVLLKAHENSPKRVIRTMKAGFEAQGDAAGFTATPVASTEPAASTEPSPAAPPVPAGVIKAAKGKRSKANGAAPSH